MMEVAEVSCKVPVKPPHGDACTVTLDDAPTAKRRKLDIQDELPGKSAAAPTRKRGFAAAAIKRVTNQYQHGTTKPKALPPSFVNAMDSAVVQFITDLTQRAWDHAHMPTNSTVRPRKTIRVADFEAVSRDNQLLDFIQPKESPQRERAISQRMPSCESIPCDQLKIQPSEAEISMPSFKHMAAGSIDQPCRFFNEGTCANSFNCPFRHERRDNSIGETLHTESWLEEHASWMNAADV